jgi:hypothetical protein
MAACVPPADPSSGRDGAPSPEEGAALAELRRFVALALTPDERLRLEDVLLRSSLTVDEVRALLGLPPLRGSQAGQGALVVRGITSP